jgi:hypothetical protein
VRHALHEKSTGLCTSAAGAAAISGAEVCDGLDNDGDGIVDDVDAPQDGVCDCLNLATIDPQVERFWLNILKWLSPGKVCQVAFSPI